MTETPFQERDVPRPDTDPQGRADHVHTANLRDFTALRRSSYDRKIAGVAGGLGRHLNIDPVILRVLFVVLAFFGGAGLLLYGAAWLMVPDDTGKRAPIHVGDGSRNAVLIVVAVIAGLLVVGDSWGGFGFPWPLVVAAIVVFAVLLSRDSSKRPVAAGPVPPPGPGPVTPGTGSPAAYAADPWGQPVPAVLPGPPGYSYPPATAAVVPAPRRRGPVLFTITVALVAAAWGVLGLYDAAPGSSVADAAYPALALAIVGGMLVLGAFWGRPGGLVFLGILASLGLAAAAVAEPGYDGDRSLMVRPASAAAVEDSYSVPAGEITLDLRGVTDPQALDGRTVDVDANAGEITVILPPGLSAFVDADVSVAGAIDVPGDTRDGFGPHFRQSLGHPSSDTPVVSLNLDLRVGHIEVRQP